MAVAAQMFARFGIPPAAVRKPRNPPPFHASQEAEATASKQRTAAARGLEQLRESLAAKAVEVGRKIERANKRAGKMPELAHMLAPFLG